MTSREKSEFKDFPNKQSKFYLKKDKREVKIIIRKTEKKQAMLRGNDKENGAARGIRTLDILNHNQAL